MASDATTNRDSEINDRLDQIISEALAAGGSQQDIAQSLQDSEDLREAYSAEGFGALLGAASGATPGNPVPSYHHGTQPLPQFAGHAMHQAQQHAMQQGFSPPPGQMGWVDDEGAITTANEGGQDAEQDARIQMIEDKVEMLTDALVKLAGAVKGLK